MGDKIQTPKYNFAKQEFAARPSQKYSTPLLVMELLFGMGKYNVKKNKKELLRPISIFSGFDFG